MSELNFIETDAQTIRQQIITDLENGVGEPLYPGDERRIFGDVLTEVLVAFYSAVNDACRQRLLRYARGEVLDALGENRGVTRMDPIPATTTMRFGINSAYSANIIIPAWVRVTSDYTHYFYTDQTVVLHAGQLYVDVTATAEQGGAEYNDIAIGEISQIVDISEIPLIDYASNITASSGGGDAESDEAYRQRIRQAENQLSTAGTAQAYRYWALSANPTVSDAVVVSDQETITISAPYHDGYAYIGGAFLLPETVEISLGNVEFSESDYQINYENELLEIQMTEAGLTKIFGSATPSPDALSVTIDRQMAGRVKIVPVCAGGTLPSKDVLDDVLAACTSDDVKPLTDIVEVSAPEVENYDIELTYYTTKADESAVVENVEGSGGAIDQYIQWQSEALARDINPDQLRKLILCPHPTDSAVGATRVEIVKPQFKEIPKTTLAVFSGTKTITHKVTD